MSPFHPAALATPAVVAAFPVLAQVATGAEIPGWVWPALFSAGIGLVGYLAIVILGDIRTKLASIDCKVSGLSEGHAATLVRLDHLERARSSRS